MSKDKSSFNMDDCQGETLKISSQENPEEYAYCRRPSLAAIDTYNKQKDQDLYKALQDLFQSCEQDKKEYDDEFVLSAGRSLIQQTILDKEYTISKESGEDEIKKTAAIVRHYFKVDPYELPVNKFYQLLAEALWLQEYHNKQQEQTFAKALVKIFSNQE